MHCLLVLAARDHALVLAMTMERVPLEPNTASERVAKRGIVENAPSRYLSSIETTELVVAAS